MIISYDMINLIVILSLENYYETIFATASIHTYRDCANVCRQRETSRIHLQAPYHSWLPCTAPPVLSRTAACACALLLHRLQNVSFPFWRNRIWCPSADHKTYSDNRNLSCSTSILTHDDMSRNGFPSWLSSWIANMLIDIIASGKMFEESPKKFLLL